MDYSLIINIALITVLYSTFIAPNISKLSTIKEAILNIRFPENVSGDGPDDEIRKNRIELSKKFAQYQTKYNEIKKFLRFFYAIIVLLVAYQTFKIFSAPFDIRKAENINDLIMLVGSIVIIIIINVAINKYMTKPYELTAFRWLARGGIAPIYIKHMYNPVLLVNFGARNTVSDKHRKHEVAISSDLRISGFNYILTAESPDSERLFYVSFGHAGKFHPGSTVTYDSGKQGAEIAIGQLFLEPGTYKLRLLLNLPFYHGVTDVYETVEMLEVDSDGKPKATRIRLAVGQRSEKSTYSMRLDDNGNIKYLYVTPSPKDDNAAVERLLSIKRTAKLLRASSRPIVISDTHGQLNRCELISRLRRRHVLVARLLSLVKRRRALHL